MSCDPIDNDNVHVCQDLQYWHYCFCWRRQMCFASHWLIIFIIRVSSWACELQTDLIFLWIKVSSVIKTLSVTVAHIQREYVQFANKVISFYPIQLLYMFVCCLILVHLLMFLNLPKRYMNIWSSFITKWEDYI